MAGPVLQHMITRRAASSPAHRRSRRRGAPSDRHPGWLGADRGSGDVRGPEGIIVTLAEQLS